VVLSLFLLGIATAFVFEDKIKAIAIESINANVNTRIDVRSIDLSLFQHFPNASIVFSDVSIQNAAPYPTAGKLLEAKSIALTFSIFNLFGNSYNLKSLHVKDASLNILRNNADQVNYIFWKKDSVESSNKFSLELQMMVFENVQFRYVDETANTDALANIQKMQLKGKFREDIFNLNADLDLTVDAVKVDEYVLLKNKRINAAISLTIDTQKEQISVHSSDIKLEGFKIQASGLWSYEGEGNQINMAFEGKDIDIQSMLSLLPSNVGGDLKKYESNGDFYFRATVIGVLNKLENPAIFAEFGVKNGTIKNNVAKIQIKNLTIDGSFNNGKQRKLGSSVLHLSNFDFQTATGRSKGSLKYENFNYPTIAIRADLNLMISEIYAFLENEKVQRLEGRCKGSFTIKGSIEDFKQFDKKGFKSIQTSGTLNLSNINFQLKGSELSYRDFEGEIQFDNNNILANQFKGNVAGCKLELNGKLGNIFSYISGTNQTLFIDATVKADDLILDNFLSTNSNEKSAYELRFPENIKLNINADIGSFSFRKFRAKEIEGKITLDAQQFRTERLKLLTLGGKVDVSGTMTSTANGKFIIDSKSIFTKVNIRQLFTAFENFGQDVLIDQNINGTLNASLIFKATMNSNLELDMDKITAFTDIRINDGLLINFEPLNALSRFISLDELKLIKFSELKNNIEISNRKIIIPAMDIKSNTLNIKLYGTHDFDNVMDYHINLFLSDLLAKKAKRNKKENDEFGEVLEDGSGRTKLFLSMKGNADNPVFEYDRVGAKASRKEVRAQEKEELKKIFKKEFGIPDKKNDKKKDGKKNESNKPEIEWE